MPVARNRGRGPAAPAARVQGPAAGTERGNPRRRQHFPEYLTEWRAAQCFPNFSACANHLGGVLRKIQMPWASPKRF